jgi:hypothetical protein
MKGIARPIAETGQQWAALLIGSHPGRAETRSTVRVLKIRFPTLFVITSPILHSF